MMKLFSFFCVIFFSLSSYGHGQTSSQEFTIPEEIYAVLNKYGDKVASTQLPDQMKSFYRSVRNGTNKLDTLTPGQALIVIACLKKLVEADTLNYNDDRAHKKLLVFSIFKGVGLKKGMTDEQLFNVGLSKYNGGLLPNGNGTNISDRLKKLGEDALSFINKDAKDPMSVDLVRDALNLYGPRVFSFEYNVDLKKVLETSLASLTLPVETPAIQPAPLVLTSETPTTLTSDAPQPETKTGCTSPDPTGNTRIASYILPINDADGKETSVHVWKYSNGKIRVFYQDSKASQMICNSYDGAAEEYK